MQTVSQTYLDLFAGQHRVEVRVKIDREGYPEGYWILQDNNLNPILTSSSANIEVVPFPSVDLQEGQLFSVTITGGLFATQSFGIGGCVSREIEVRFILGEAVIPRMAKIQPEVRLVNDNGDMSEWIPKGTFWLDTRELDKETGIMTIRGYDAMLKGENLYIVPGEDTGLWPRTMASVATEIAGMMGLTIDARTTLDQNYEMQLPTDYTMRELLGYIATANCGNWVITDEGKLRLIRVNDTVDSVDLGLAAKTYHISEPYQAFSKVELDLSEELYVEAGDTTGRTLEVPLPVVTTSDGEDIAEDILDALEGFVYTPYEASGAILDPAYEIGDAVTVGDNAVGTTTSLLARQTMRLDSLCPSDVSAPGEAELDHEYPYKSTSQREINRRISTVNTRLTVAVDSITARVEEVAHSGIATVITQYAMNTSSTTAPTAGWGTTFPTWENGKHIWYRTKATVQDNTVTETREVISTPAVITASSAKHPAAAMPGYYLSTSQSTPTGGEWQLTLSPFTWKNGYYLFTKVNISWSDGTASETTPTLTLDDSIADLEEKYSEVKQTADKIDWIVASGTSASNFTMTSRALTLVSSSVNLVAASDTTGTQSTLTLTAPDGTTKTATIQMTGLVSFTALGNPQSQTFIDGANITAGTIRANAIKVNTVYSQANDNYRILSSRVYDASQYVERQIVNVGHENVGLYHDSHIINHATAFIVTDDNEDRIDYITSGMYISPGDQIMSPISTGSSSSMAWALGGPRWGGDTEFGYFNYIYMGGEAYLYVDGYGSLVFHDKYGNETTLT